MHHAIDGFSEGRKTDFVIRLGNAASFMKGKELDWKMSGDENIWLKASISVSHNEIGV